MIPDGGAAPRAAPAEGEGADPGARLTPAAVLVRVGAAEFALPVDAVREALRSPSLSRVPFATPAVRGVFSLRGEIVPLIDLGTLLFDRPVDPVEAVLVVRTEDSDAPVGVAVDLIAGMLDAGAAEVRPPLPEAEAGVPAGWITGLLVLDEGRPVAVLDLARVLEAADGSRALLNPNEPFSIRE